MSDIPVRWGGGGEGLPEAPGPYETVLTDVEAVMMKHGERLKWWFTIVCDAAKDDTHFGYRVSKITDRVPSDDPRSSFRHILSVFFGEGKDVREEWQKLERQTGDLSIADIGIIGHPFKVNIIHRGRFANVDRIFPSKMTPAQAAKYLEAFEDSEGHGDSRSDESQTSRGAEGPVDRRPRETEQPQSKRGRTLDEGDLAEEVTFY